MTTMAPSTERLHELDRQVEELKNAFVDGLTHLQEVASDDAFEERWESIAKRFRQLRYGFEAADFDKEQILTISTALLDIYELLDERDSLESLDDLLINFERIRHVVRDALDEHVNGVSGSSGEILRELFERLPGVPQQEVAELVGVDRRTFLRWKESNRAPSRRLRIVARLVAILRHNWTTDGIVAWFHRPRRDLGGKTPLSLLAASVIDEEPLISAARAGRSQYAT